MPGSAGPLFCSHVLLPSCAAGHCMAVVLNTAGSCSYVCVPHEVPSDSRACHVVRLQYRSTQWTLAFEV